MLSIFVPTTPIPQARPRLLKSGRAWSPDNAFRKAVFVEAIHVRPMVPLDGPLRLEAEFIFPRPQSCLSVQVLKWTKGDIDNLLKAAMDALTEAKWWVDDGRVAEVQSRKRYPLLGERPGAVLAVRRLQDPGWRHA